MQIYLQAIQDSIKALPREIGAANNEPFDLRPNTAVSKARDVLREHGKPMYLVDILKAMGRSTEKKERLSLGGSLSGYVRDNQIFTRPAPNTFGLIEFLNAKDKEQTDSFPDTFGKL